MKVLLVGAGGQVGQALLRAFTDQAIECVACTRVELDITDKLAVQQRIERERPCVVINAAAYTAVDKAEQEAEAAFAINTTGAEYLAIACARAAIPLIHFSTDYVFDGTQLEAYNEDAVANPQSVYGLSKWQGEAAVRLYCPQHYIIRVSWVFGIDGANFVKTMVRLMQQRSELSVVADQHGAPTSARSIAALVLKILPFAARRQAFGTYHFTNQALTTWYDFAVVIKNQMQDRLPLMVQHIKAINTCDYPTLARRPANSALDTQKIQQVFGVTLCAWRDELQHVLSQIL